MRIPFAIFGVALLLPTLCAAYSGSSSSRHELSTSAGISAPSETSAVYQNAAGLMYNAHTGLDIHSGFGNDQFSNPDLGGGIYTGNGSFGAAVGVNYFTGPKTSAAFYGLGVNASRFALGVAGFTTLSNGGGSTFNAGLLIGPMDKTRFGVTVMDFTNTGREFGFGISYDMDTSFSIVVDGAVNSDFGNLGLQPGLIARANGAALTVSYGFRPGSGTGGTAQISDGFTAGGSVNLSQRASLQLYYKQLYRYYAQLNFSL